VLFIIIQGVKVNDKFVLFLIIPGVTVKRLSALLK